MATLVAFFMRNLPDFKSNSRPLNISLEKNDKVDFNVE